MAGNSNVNKSQKLYRSVGAGTPCEYIESPMSMVPSDIGDSIYSQGVPAPTARSSSGNSNSEKKNQILKHKTTSIMFSVKGQTISIELNCVCLFILM